MNSRRQPAGRKALAAAEPVATIIVMSPATAANVNLAVSMFRGAQQPIQWLLYLILILLSAVLYFTFTGDLRPQILVQMLGRLLGNISSNAATPDS